MSRYKKHQVLSTIYNTGVIPVFYSQDASLCLDVIRACYAGGIRAFEFTNRGDFAHEAFSALSRAVQLELDGMVLGVGSVINPATADLYIQLGADFVVSPGFVEETAKTCNRRMIPYSPGCGSVSEIVRAQEYGVDLIKVFPGAQVGGPKFVEAVKGPMPWTMIMPTGGVEPTEANLGAWFKAGVCCVGMGSQLITKEILEQRDWATLSKTCADSLDLVRRFRK